MNNYKRNFFILLLMSMLACLSLSWYAYNQKVENTSKSTQISALTDTLVQYKTKQGKSGAFIPVFKGTKAEVLATLKQTDPALYTTAKNTSGLKSITNIKTVFKTDTTVRVDTIYLPDKATPLQKLFLTKNITNKWYSAKVTVNDDSLSLGLQVKDDFDVSTRDKSNGFLRRKSYVIDVINNNPYSMTTSLKSFEIKPKSKTGLKISIGLAAAVGGYLLLR